MIPHDYVTAWRAQAPWIQDFQVEQDLIISRALVEIFSREHFSVFGFANRSFNMDSRWFSGSAEVQSYELDELLGTKLRALYQRRKGRDLFDLALALEQDQVDPERVVHAFSQYMNRDGRRVTRAEFKANLTAKRHDPLFNTDIGPLLAAGHRWDIEEAFRAVSSRLITMLD